MLKLKRGTTVAAYHSDGLGSVVSITDATSGGSLKTYRYDAFGKPIAQTGTLANAYTYTGRELDGSGLYYYRARYYLPSAGRFLTPDPIGLAGGINAYTYVSSNPVNYTDPFGLMAGRPMDPAWPSLPPLLSPESPALASSLFSGDSLVDLSPEGRPWDLARQHSEIMGATSLIGLPGHGHDFSSGTTRPGLDLGGLAGLSLDTLSFALDAGENYYVLPDGRWRSVNPTLNGRSYFPADWGGNRYHGRSAALGRAAAFSRANNGLFFITSGPMVLDAVSDPSGSTISPLAINAMGFAIATFISGGVVVGPPLVGVQYLLAPEVVGPAMGNAIPPQGQGVGVVPGFLAAP